MSGAYDFYNDASDPRRWGRDEMPEAFDVTRRWLAEGRPEGAVVELGCGRGPLSGIDRHYVGLDLSLPALADAPPFRKVAGDMERLPFRSRSVAFVLSWAAIEHVPNPERVLAEIERIVKPGGIALLAPAWHCRPWAAEGLEFQPREALTRSQRLRKVLLPLRNHVLWRALFEAPHRLVRELRARRGPIAFTYDRLSPNLTEYVGTDSDAFTSMDPQAAILYFTTRGWTAISHPTARERMTVRNGAVVLRKASG